MSRRQLNDAHHLMRWVSHEKLEYDPDTFEIKGIMPIAFQVRPQDKGKLSTHWIEYFEGIQSEQVIRSARDLGGRVHASRKKGGAFAIGNVAMIKQDGIDGGGSHIEATLSNWKANPAHAEVTGVAADDLTLQMLLATNSWSKLLYASEALDF